MILKELEGTVLLATVCVLLMCLQEIKHSQKQWQEITGLYEQLPLEKAHSLKDRTTEKKVPVHSKFIFKNLALNNPYFMTSKQKKKSVLGKKKNIHFHCKLILGPKMN